MDTSSYLRSQGWLGTGHALNSHKPGLGLEAGQRHPGLAKPLTIPQKQNVLGVGKKVHDSHADQWWARAFDDVLKGVNAGPEAQKPTAGGQEGGSEPRTNMISMRMGGWGKHGNLYGNFVRGEGLRGTFLRAEEEEEEEEVVGGLGGKRDGVANGQIIDKGTKRKWQDGVDEDFPAGKKICKEEVATNGTQEASQLQTSKVAVQEPSISVTSEPAAGSSREQRRRQRQQQEARKAKELADVQHTPSITVKEPINGDLKETKEERRQRKEKGKTKAAEAADTQRASKPNEEEPVSLVQESTETKTHRKQRRQERRARKAAQTAKPQIALKSPAEELVSRKDRGSETKEERRQRREERRARKATEKSEVAVHQTVVSAMPIEGVENGKANKVVLDSRVKRKSAMADEPSAVALKREKKARDEKKKKRKREQKASV